NQQPSDYAIVGVDDLRTQVLCTKLAAEGGRRVMAVSAELALGKGVSVLDGKLSDSMEGRAAAPADLRRAKALPGKHNHQNAAAAYAACRALGMDAREILDGMEQFPGLAHRLEAVGEVDGVRFINDSKATNAQAADQALKAYPGAYWILGGRPKDDGIDELEPRFGDVRKAYLIGQAADSFAEVLKGKAEAVKSRTLEAAILSAFEDAKASGDEGPVILFSPACASFDQFSDFEARGEAFKALVRNLTLQAPARALA
ncbi:MAG: cyanophycin synthetase, partial [Pseudomonadota bacterium]